MFKYQELIYDEKQILDLYLENEWYAYTNNKDLLFEGIKNSLYCYGCYQNDVLIGLIRCIGDGNTILYIQDILIKPDLHHQGIGSHLITHVLEKYNHVRQILLITDQTEKQQNFYQKNGFVKLNDMSCVGFIYKR